MKISQALPLPAPLHAIAATLAMISRFAAHVTEYGLTPPRWPRDFPLKIAVIADPRRRAYMSARASGCLPTTRSRPTSWSRFGVSGKPPFRDAFCARGDSKGLWASAARRSACDVLGNHDWWFNHARIRGVLDGAGIPVMENDAGPPPTAAGPFGLLASATRSRISARRPLEGVDDLAGHARRRRWRAGDFAAHSPIFRRCAGAVR
jgi:hypothetical protein